jgi:hypothetical protein
MKNSNKITLGGGIILYFHTNDMGIIDILFLRVPSSIGFRRKS